MTTQKFYVGSHGPYLYDDTASINDQDGDFSGLTQNALTTSGGVAAGFFNLLDTDQSNALSLIWNEDDDTDRVLNVLVAGGDRSLTLNENLIVSDGYNVTLQALGQANSLVLNESITVGDGNDGTITFKQASKALNVEGTNLIPYTGWPVTPGVTISFVGGETRTLTVTDGGSAFYYCEGVKYILGENKTVQLPTSTEGLWYVYFDGATLTASQTIWSFSAEDKVLVSIVYWDATNLKVLDSPMYELHNYKMDGATHSRLHYGGGAEWEEGLAVSDAGSETINVTAGKLRDEDIIVTITDGDGGALWEQILSPARLPIYYRDGASAWRIYDIGDKKTTTDVGYVDVSNNLKYNLLDGTWGIATVAAPNHVAMWAVSTNNQKSPVSLIMGQRIDTVLANAKANNVFSGLDLTGLPFEEMIVLARIIIKDTGASPYYSIEEIVDLRVTNITGNITTPLTGDYVLRSLFDADTFLYAAADNTPIPYPPANVMAALSGHAGAAFSLNEQNLTNVGTIGCDTITLVANEDITLSGTGHITSGSEGFIVGTLTITDGSIDDTDGAIAFGDTNLTGLGTLSAGAFTLTIDETASLSDYALNAEFDSHHDRHDPENGADALDCAAAAEISVVVAASEGSAHEFARSDHVHAINHAITDNHIVTIDGTTNAPVNTDYAAWTANGLEGRDKSQMLTFLNVADGADVTGSNAPQAHAASHLPSGGDPLTTASPSAITVVVAGSEGTAESFARSDHVHNIGHAITDNHIVTIDGTANQNEHAVFGAGGIAGLTDAELLAALSGHAGAAFDFNGQALTGVGAIGCGAITATGNIVLPANGVIGVTDGNPQIVFDNANNWLEITGNVGIGVSALQTWEVVWTALQIGGLGAIWTVAAAAAGGVLSIGHNAYRDSLGADRYIITDEASRWYMLSGGHSFQVAVSGTAGDAIPWKNVLMMDSAANVNIAVHDAATVGLKLGGTLVTKSAAQINAAPHDFTTLNAIIAAANAAVDFNAQALTGVGAIGAASLTLTGNIVLPANGVIGVTDGNPQIVFDNANNWLEITGSVGFGVADPDEAIEVAGSIKSTAAAGVKIIPSTATDAAYATFTNTGGAYFFGVNNAANTTFPNTGAYGQVIYRPAGETFALSRANVIDFFVDGSGNVGFGVIDPDELVEIYKVGTQLKLSGGAADYATFAVSAAGALTITTVDVDAALGHLILAPDGEVQISSPAIATDHGAAATDQILNFCYGAGDPPAANTTTEGAIFWKYTA